MSSSPLPVDARALTAWRKSAPSSPTPRFCVTARGFGDRFPTSESLSYPVGLGVSVRVCLFVCMCAYVCTYVCEGQIDFQDRRTDVIKEAKSR